MSEVKIVGRDVDTLVLNVCYADAQFQPMKQELDDGMEQEQFISRAIGKNGRSVDDPIEGPDIVRLRWKQRSTLDFSKHTSPIFCCIHPKLAEIWQNSSVKKTRCF